jgi:hypothetical protein
VSVKDKNETVKVSKKLYVLEIDTSDLTVGKTRYALVKNYKGSDSPTITITSGSTKICKVASDYGFLMPISKGTAKISVKVKSGSYSKTQSVTVNVKENDNVLVGCDVSKWQGTISGSKLKAENMDFVIIRGGNNYTIDSCFKYNVTQCQNNNLQYGLYWYACAQNEAEAIKEADTLLSALKSAGITPGKEQFTFPIYYDLEDSKVSANGTANIEKVTKAFVNELQENGIDVSNIGIYASKYWFESKLNRSYYSTFKDNFWVAKYNSPGSNPSFTWQKKTTHAQMWQVGSGFKNVSGVSSTYLDMNYYYK